MNDLRKLLRYEIPGIIAIMYFLLFSSPVLYAVSYRSNCCSSYVLNLLLESTFMIAVLALPIGYLIYHLYLVCDYQIFFKNRKGYEIIVEILKERSSGQNVKSWWEKQDHAVKNEILDTIFYREEKDLGEILERFLNFYHSNLVIGIFAPIVAFLGTVVLGSVLYYSSQISSEGFVEGVKSSIPVLLIACVLIIVVYSMTVQPTKKEGDLKKRIDEMETNILLMRKREIWELIDRKKKLSDQMKVCAGKPKKTRVEELKMSRTSKFVPILSFLFMVLFLFGSYGRSHWLQIGPLMTLLILGLIWALYKFFR